MVGAWKWGAILGAGSSRCSMVQSPKRTPTRRLRGHRLEGSSAGARTGAEPLPAVAMRGPAASRVSYGSLAVQAFECRRLRLPVVPDCLEFLSPCLLGVYFSDFRS